MSNTGPENGVPPAAPGGPEPGFARREARRPGTRGPLVGRATSLLASPRGVAFLALCAGLGAYYAVHASLPDTSTWGDVAILGLLLMPAVFGLVYLVLPLHRAKPLQLLLVGLAFGALALVFKAGGLPTLSNFSKLAAMTVVAFWFLGYFETVSWVVLVACIIPWVDAYSVWRGPTSNIVEHHRQVFSNLSFAFPVPGENNAANLGLPDLLFFGLFLAASARFNLRPRWTWLLLTLSFGATIAITVAWDKAGLPALPLLSVAFLAANGDLLWRAVRARRSRR